MRALRPYFTCLSPDLHILSPMMNRLEKESQGSEAGTSGISRDQVRRIVIFGCGPGGALGMSLAQRCGWQVVRFVDNNREAWGSRIAGIPVKSPASLRAHDFDLVIVSSRSGKEQICNQLRSMGFRKGEDFAYYLDPVVIGNVEIRLRES
jgi:FlaA1/EpsC-like NDP-sugar epimerase